MSEFKYQLPKEFAEKWVKALRSGEYQQGTQSLHLEDTYCCLGVACVVAGIDYVPNQDWIKESMVKGTIIPRVLVGSAAQSELVYKVSSMNDGNETFEDIADWIEQNVEFV